MTAHRDTITTTEVTAGADTHAQTVHVAVINQIGAPLGDAEFPTTGPGYRDALAFLTSFGAPVARVGIEGTSSYGAGLSQVVAEGGLDVVEVNRPDRSHRRGHGKSDSIDAYQAAEAALSGRAHAAPKSHQVHGLRAIRTARRSALKASTAASNQIRDLLATAPSALRDTYRHLTGARRIAALARCRPERAAPEHQLALRALARLARRHQDLKAEAAELEAELRTHTAGVNPYLLSLCGVGPDNAAALLITAGANPDRMRNQASFAALCGTAPVPASSGKVQRYRLSRGGDRQANAALHNIAINRLRTDPRTRAYADKLHASGRHTDKGVLRKLKRAIARDIYQALTNPQPLPDLADLRPLRQAKNITLAQAAQALGTYPTKLSRTETGTRPDYQLAEHYRAWLTTA